MKTEIKVKDILLGLLMLIQISFASFAQGDDCTGLFYGRTLRTKDPGLNEEIPDQTDPYIGDWKTSDEGILVKVYRMPEGDYRANLCPDSPFYRNTEEVLEGEIRNGEVLVLKGEKWSGTIENRQMTLMRNDESFQLRQVRTIPPTLNQTPPEGAIVLFNGHDLNEWSGHMPKQWLVAGGPAGWKIVPGGYLEVIPGAGSVISKREFEDFLLHLEFRLPGEPVNGGVYLQSRYEINIKDSYGQLEGSPCGAIGNISKPENLPLIDNLALPPMQWQTFDIEFKAPRFDDSNGQKIESARITLSFNGTMLYENQAVDEVKGAATRLGEASKGPLLLQEHGSAYQFRNIWIIENPSEKQLHDHMNVDTEMK